MRVVDFRPEIRGIGVVTPIGVSVEDFWSAATSGRCGIVHDEELAHRQLRSQVCARVATARLFSAPGWSNRWMDKPRLMQLALTAASQAWAEARVARNWDGLRKGLVFSSAMGVVVGATSNNASPGPPDGDGTHHPALGNALEAAFEIAGPVIGISDGCTGGLDAFITACELIENEEVDACLVVASDAPLSALTVAAMDNLGVLSRRNDRPGISCPPFDAERQGMVMAEGAAALVLARGERPRSPEPAPLVVVDAHSSVSNCRSMVSLRTASEDMVRCIVSALSRGDIRPDEIDHLNVHGSGTLQNDEAEATALKSVFGNRLTELPAVALKSLTGHALAASNGIELVAEVMMLRSGLLPPARGDGARNPWGVKLVTGQALSHPAVRGLKLNHGFGGFHSCAILSRG